MGEQRTGVHELHIADAYVGGNLLPNSRKVPCGRVVAGHAEGHGGELFHTPACTRLEASIHLFVTAAGFAKPTSRLHTEASNHLLLCDSGLALTLGSLVSQKP